MEEIYVQKDDWLGPAVARFFHYISPVEKYLFIFDSHFEIGSKTANLTEQQAQTREQHTHNKRSKIKAIIDIILMEYH